MKKKKGFTLVELLVVISIIAMLLAVLMPALGKAKLQASAIICTTDVRSLSLAWFLYIGDNNGKIVGAHTYLAGTETLAGQRYASSCDKTAVYSDVKANMLTNWVEMPQMENGLTQKSYPKKEYEILGIQRGLLFPYVGKKLEVFHCPNDKRLIENKKAGYGGYRSYSIAGCMDGYYDSIGTKVIKKHSQIRQPGSKYVFVEEKWTGSPGYNLDAWQLNPTGDSWTDPVSVAHGDKSILGFADGHGEAIKWKDKRTILFSKDRETNVGNGTVSATQPDNPDLKYMQERWATVK